MLAIVEMAGTEIKLPENVKDVSITGKENGSTIGGVMQFATKHFIHHNYHHIVEKSIHFIKDVIVNVHLKIWMIMM